MKPSTIVLLSGATGAIGKAIARQLAQNLDYEVVLLCRNQGKANSLVQTLQNTTHNPHIRYVLADVSRNASIQSLAQKWTGPLHILINNAAIASPQRQETPEGIEQQWATNVLGYYWLTIAFEQILKETTKTRVINVASYWAGNLDLSDVEFKHRTYNNDTAYRQSKQANRMLSVAFAKKLMGQVAVNSCHPGDVNSTLSRDLGFGGHESPDTGAQTPVWLATTKAGQDNTGKYFENQQITSCRFGLDHQAVEQLYEKCSQY